MRTTLTIDDELNDALRERARILELPFKQVVNDVLRRGLALELASEPRKDFRVESFATQFAAGEDQFKLNQLNDEMEVEEFFDSDAG